MRRLALLAALLLLSLPLIVLHRVSAQPDQGCDPAALIREANGLTSAGEPRADLFTLSQFADKVKAMQDACTPEKLDALAAGTPIGSQPSPTWTPVQGISVRHESPTPTPVLSKAEAAAATRTAAAESAGATRTAIADSRMATADIKTATAMFLAQYKPIDARELSSYPDRHTGEKVMIRGRVFNLVDEHTLQIWLSGASYEAVVIEFSDIPDGIYKDTVIQIYGEVKGTIDLINGYGATITQPLIEADVIKKA